MITLISIVLGIVSLTGIYFYILRLGRQKEKQKQLKDAYNESIEINKDKIKRASDSTSDIRERLSEYARKE